MPVVTSKHLKTATELTLVADIRPEFVWTKNGDLVSYGTRLGLMLKTFFELRRAATEQTNIPSVGPLEQLRSLYNFTWSIFDRGSKLLLSVTFDRPWEPYIRAIVDQAGPLLDAIFCHCTGYEGHSSEDGYLAFASWVRERQIDAALFYAADPQLTVDDQRYLKEFERRYGESSVTARFAERAARLSVGDPAEDLARSGSDDANAAARARAALMRVQRSVGAVVALRPYFHVPSPELLALAAPGEANAREALEREARFFDRAGWLLLEPTLPSGGDLGLSLEVHRALRSMREHALWQRPAAAGAPAPRALGQNVQANILTPYEKMTHGAVVLLGFDDSAAAKQFLGGMWREVTRDEDAATASVGVNVALTFSGLRTLGLSGPELESFPREFQEGMRERAGLLGDLAEEHPANWTEPLLQSGLDGASNGAVLALSSVDMLLMVQVRAAPRSTGDCAADVEWGPAHPAWQRVHELVGNAPGVRALHVQTLLREYMAGGRFVRERFGFADGISQPQPRSRAEAQQGSAQGPLAGDEVELGELILGHANDRGEAYPPGLPAAAVASAGSGAASLEARVHELTKDGSFLVVRKLEQDTAAFEQFVLEHASQFTGGRGGAEELYGKLMGRYRDGTPLVPSEPARSAAPAPDATLNDFDYSRDPVGDFCPLASHARRTNPRTPATKSVHGSPLRLPRMLRRGFSYGPLSGSSAQTPRGLMFMAYGASIAEQFEIIQRWINGGNSTGLASSHADPIVSHACPRVIQLMDGGQARHLLKKKPFVTLKWGLYLFAPAISALEALAHRSAEARAAAVSDERERQVREGRELIQRLRALELIERTSGKVSAPGMPSSVFGWKLALEDRAPQAQASARAIWAAIRADHGGVLRTGYGVLVASPALVRQVLSDETAFSVREYWHRMQSSVGPLYLGMDRCPVRHPLPRAADRRYESEVAAGAYDAASELPNAFIYSLARGRALSLAKQEAAIAFERLQRRRSGRLDGIVGLRDYAVSVVSALSRRWFGLPLDDGAFELFQTAALAIFFPNPEPAVLARAELNRPLLERASEVAVGKRSELEESLAARGFTGAVPAALIGGTQGFLAATAGSFLSVAHQWLETERLPRLRRWLLSAPGQAWLDAAPAQGSAAPSLLERELLGALSRSPVPDLLHRTAVRELALESETIRPSDRVVVSIASALAEAPDDVDLLFGGAHSREKESGAFIHGCPGKEAALGVMLGMFVDLLNRDLRREGLLRVSERRPSL